MKPLTAEIFGTFFLVFMGCGAIVVNDYNPGSLGHVGISLSFGLIVMSMIYSIGNTSGAHMNPAVTLGFLLARRISATTAFQYISVQVVSAIAASILLKILFPSHQNLGTTFPKIGLASGFGIEFLMTFLLMYVIFNVSTGHMEKGIMAGVAVGGTVALEALVAGPLTGASMNPARSIGPALISGNLSDIWIYILGPISGAGFAWPAFLFSQEIKSRNN